jgi:hypothetical protein
MRITTKSLINNARRFNDIVKDDQKVCFIYCNYSFSILKYLFVLETC